MTTVNETEVEKVEEKSEEKSEDKLKKEVKKKAAPKSPVKKKATKSKVKAETKTTETEEKPKTKKEKPKKEKAEPKTEKEEPKSDTFQTFTVEVKKEEIESNFDEALLKYASDFKLPGFRKGKAPLDVVKARIKDAVREEVVEKMLNQAVFKKIDDEKMQVISQPAVEKVDYEEGKDLKAEVTVELLPVVELPDLEALEVEIPAKELEPEAYDEKSAIERVLKSNQRQMPVTNREIQENDMVTLKYQSKILETKRLDRRKDGQYIVTKESAFDIIDLYDDIVGKKNGDTLEIKRKYPEDYTKKPWAGKEVEHYIQVDSVFEMVTPELNDAFIKGAGLSDEAEFKKKLKDEYDTYSSRHLDEKKIERILEKMYSVTDFPLPKALVEQEMGRMVQQNPHQFNIQDEIQGAKVMEILKTNAENAVRLHFIIEAVKKKYELKVTADDLENAYKTYAEQSHMDVKEIRKFYMKPDNKHHLEDSLGREKVMDMLKEKIKIKEV